MSYILGVDPGGTVGYALYKLDDEPFNSGDLQAGQAPVNEFLDWARESINSDFLVVMERFTITTNTATLSAGGTHDALDVIGVTKHLCRWAGAQFEFQTPAQAKNFVNNVQLKTLGLWVPGQDHARDAIRHLIFGIVNSTKSNVSNDLKLRMTA